MCPALLLAPEMNSLERKIQSTLLVLMHDFLICVAVVAWVDSNHRSTSFLNHVGCSVVESN